MHSDLFSRTHPHLHPLAGIFGTWVGEGRGSYPTIKDFAFRETLTFAPLEDPRRPIIRYHQATENAAGNPMHFETGYLRIPEPGVAELILAQLTGQSEVLLGRVEINGVDEAAGKVEFTFAESTVVNTPSAKSVDATARSFTFTGDSLHVTFGMQAVGVEMTPHLESNLRRA